jgi:hypothetical protein
MEQNKQQLPNATATLVLGILSIVISCGIIGLILGIIGLTISKEGKLLHDKEPNLYEGWGNLNAGRIMSLIGIILGSLALLYFILALAIGGSILALITGLAN